MSNTPKALRGMRDILPDQIALWQFVERTVQSVFEAYHFTEIRTPLLEMTELFQRSIGEVTDIVSKEMYSFADRHGDSVTLRPENTAGCARAALEHNLIEQPQRLWYHGPMFRYERPQRGRQRQFHQFGVEALGFTGPDIDLELLLMSARLWKQLGLKDVHLEINTLGDAEERLVYRQALVSYLEQHIDHLDEDSRQRLQFNPLRILDSKIASTREIIAQAPVITEFLGEETRSHFETIKSGLEAAGIAYTHNPHLVRGLDYYNRLVFEWVTTELGAQGTVCAGGRYDGLVTQLGGKPTPAVGFAIGEERLIELLLQRGLHVHNHPHVYLIAVGEEAMAQALPIAERLRDRLESLRLCTHSGGGSFKSQFKKADRSGAEVALVLGSDEIAQGQFTLKYLRADQPQQTLRWDELVSSLETVIAQSVRVAYSD